MPELENNWPETLKEAHLFDRLEIGGERFNPGYCTLYDQRRQKTLEALMFHCPAPAKVLDLAAAGGNFSIAAAKLGYQVTWNDLRDELIPYVRSKVPEGCTLDFVAGNILELPDNYEGKFDAIMALEVLEHVAYPDDFINKLSTLVKPGGVIIMSTPNGAYFRNSLPRYSDFPDPSVFEADQFKPNSDGHIFLLYEDEIRRFGNAAGVEILDYNLFTNPLSAAHVKLGFLHKVLPRSVIAALESLTRRLPKFLLSRVMCCSLVVYRN